MLAFSRVRDRLIAQYLRNSASDYQQAIEAAQTSQANIDGGEHQTSDNKSSATGRYASGRDDEIGRKDYESLTSCVGQTGKHRTAFTASHNSDKSSIFSVPGQVEEVEQAQPQASPKKLNPRTFSSLNPRQENNTIDSQNPDLRLTYLRCKQRAISSILKKIIAQRETSRSEDPIKRHAAEGQQGQNRNGSASTSKNSSQPPSEERKEKRSSRDKVSKNNNNKGHTKRRSRKETSRRDISYYACPFHKHDPERYKANLATGNRYKSCMNISLRTIADVR